MRHLPALLLLLAAPFAGAAEPAADGPVTVEFVAPEKFTDARYDGRSRRDASNNPVLGDFRRYLEKEAPRHLAPGQRLAIRFTDIDLAGDIEPTTHPELLDVRIVKSIHPPRLRFAWTLHAADGSLLRQGEEQLRDLGFNMDSALLGNDRLRYEQRMLRRWLGKTFGGGAD
jgi:hypothetical protein